MRVLGAWITKHGHNALDAQSDAERQ